MEVVPCSRVAHLHHHHLPTPLPDQELLQKNKIRVADTWMDAYSKIYYRRDTLAHFIRQVCVCVHVFLLARILIHVCILGRSTVNFLFP